MLFYYLLPPVVFTPIQTALRSSVPRAVMKNAQGNASAGKGFKQISSLGQCVSTIYPTYLSTKQADLDNENDY